MAGIGYSFNGDDLSDMDYKIFSLIDSELIKLENQEIKRGAKNNG